MNNIRDLSTRPSTYIIDICGICNLKCTLCPQGVGVSGHDQPVRYMPYQNFETIFGKIKAYAKHVSLHNWSEPFLHPDISKIIKFINREAPDVYLHISSNGVILNEERIKKLSGAKIDFLEISISGLTQEVYEKYHKNGQIKKVISNVGLLIKNHELEIKKLSIKYLQFEYNISSYFTIKKELLKQLGIEKFPPFVELRIIPAYVTAAVAGYEKKYPTELVECETKRIPMKDTCNYPFEQLVIRSDGELFPCCVVPYDQNFSIGNLLATGSQDFASSQKYVDFRESLIKGMNPVCNSCNLITRWKPNLPIDRRFVKGVNRLTNKFLSLKSKLNT